jgi:hypothetical protein
LRKQPQSSQAACQRLSDRLDGRSGAGDVCQHGGGDLAHPCAPKGTPRDVIARLNAVTAKLLRSPDLAERLSRDALDPVGSAPGEFAAYLQGEPKKWARAIQIAGAKPE